MTGWAKSRAIDPEPEPTSPAGWLIFGVLWLGTIGLLLALIAWMIKVLLAGVG